MIGLGNPLSRDDAFGLQVLDRLAQQEPCSLPETVLARADTDLIAQIDAFPTYSQVILVDALLDPNAALGRRGDVIVVDEEIFQTWPETSTSVHQFSPLLAVKLFRKLYPEAPTRITLVAYCTDGVSMGTSEYGPLEESVIDAAVRLILSLLS